MRSRSRGGVQMAAALINSARTSVSRASSSAGTYASRAVGCEVSISEPGCAEARSGLRAGTSTPNAQASAATSVSVKASTIWMPWLSRSFGSLIGSRGSRGSGGRKSSSRRLRKAIGPPQRTPSILSVRAWRGLRPDELQANTGDRAVAPHVDRYPAIRANRDLALCDVVNLVVPAAARLGPDVAVKDTRAVDIDGEVVRLVAVRLDEQQRHAVPAGDQIVDLEVELLPVVPGRETPEQGSIFRADLCSGRTRVRSARRCVDGL